MRGTTRETTVGIREGPSGKPWTSMAFGPVPPSSGPSGHLPPRGGKAVMFTTPKIRDGQQKTSGDDPLGNHGWGVIAMIVICLFSGP